MRHGRAALELFFELSLDLFACAETTELRFRSINAKSWTRLLGWDEEQILAKGLRGLVVSAELPKTLNAFRRLKAGDEVRDFENELLHADGSTRYVQWNGVNAHGYAFLVGRDVTDGRKALSAARIAVAESTTHRIELERAHEQLVRTNEALASVGHMAGHDLAELVRGISGVATLVLQDEDLSPKSRQRLNDFVVAPALRMRQMTEDLRGYLRSIQEDHGPDRQQQVSLEVALDRAIEALNGSIDAASARIIRSGLCVVTGNPLQLEAVFQNLISNACKYRSESRQLLITVSAVELEDDVHISVRDNGIGFEPAFREDIFKLGRRLHNGESPKWGSGVGLATVRYHVETHGGRVWADSTPGEGTAIHFTIPRHTHEDSSHR